MIIMIYEAPLYSGPFKMVWTLQVDRSQHFLFKIGYGK